MFPFTVEHYIHSFILDEKTIKHFVVLRFQKVNMCRDGLLLSFSLSLSPHSPSFFLICHLEYVCVRIDGAYQADSFAWSTERGRGRERERERDFVVTNRLAIRRRRRRTYCFVVGRCHTYVRTGQVEKCQRVKVRVRTKSSTHRPLLSRF